MISWSALLVLLPLVFAHPLQRRTTQSCGQFDVIKSSPYSLLTNLWGKSNATSGSQCSVLDSVDGSTAAWHTAWEWTGGDSVKSFPNVQLDVGINQQLSVISTMQSEWRWSQENTETIVADVAYDFFTAYYPGSSNVNEVMVWLASFNAGPISYNYDTNGNAVPIETNLGINGHRWNLYHGSNGYNEVFSFLPVKGPIQSFKGDTHKFFAHLINTGRIASSEYLTVAQAGTETTSGSGIFKTSAYSLAIE